jgi:hypothetical protein
MAPFLFADAKVDIFFESAKKRRENYAIVCNFIVL